MGRKGKEEEAERAEGGSFAHLERMRVEELGGEKKVD